MVPNSEGSRGMVRVGHHGVHHVPEDTEKTQGTSSAGMCGQRLEKAMHTAKKGRLPQ